MDGKQRHGNESRWFPQQGERSLSVFRAEMKKEKGKEEIYSLLSKQLIGRGHVMSPYTVCPSTKAANCDVICAEG